MDGPPNGAIPSFRGNSLEECDLFIQNVRTVAWTRGKIRDPAWMADFASIGFLGSARSWYTHLPQDVKEDWSKLEAALVDRWSMADDENGLQNVAVSAAAPPLRDYETPYYHTCVVLRATVAGSETTFYVRRAGENADFSLTEDLAQAFRVHFDPLASSKLLGCVNDRSYSWLALHWRQSKPYIGRGSTHYTDISTVDSETMKSSRSNSGPFQLAIWKTLPTGEVIPVWRDGMTETYLTVFCNTRSIFPVADPKAYQMDCPSEKQMKLFIQRIQ